MTTMMMTTTTTSWRRPDDDVLTTTSWRRRDDVVMTTSWWRRVFYVDYSPFHPKTLPRKIPFYRAVILFPPPWNLEFCSLFGWFNLSLDYISPRLLWLTFLLFFFLFYSDDDDDDDDDDVVTTRSWWGRFWRRLFTVSAQNVNEKNAVLPSGYFYPRLLETLSFVLCLGDLSLSLDNISLSYLSYIRIKNQLTYRNRAKYMLDKMHYERYTYKS